ncbi:MAG: glycoside hydrolase family 13 protein [Lachnospiraceae bacterium]|nr:glycoside hydrolase family 13 protein [Lachnospiraceae bacterium]
MSESNILNVISHIYNSTTILNFGALFSDGTPNFVTPAEPEVGEGVTIRFRTARNNVDGVDLVVGDKHIPMERTEVSEIFDYYSVVIPNLRKKFRYYFEVHSGRLRVVYNRLGVLRDANHDYDFQIVPGFKVPDWAKGAVFYQIYVDRFKRGDSSNDVLDGEYYYVGHRAHRVKDWHKVPDNMDVANFYGGDLQGVIDKLDYLKNLGVEAIYFNPIFVSPSNHKYDIQDYDYVDPHIGKIINDEGELLPEGCEDNTQATRYINRVTNKENLEASNQLFIKLVEEAHSRGIKIILDGVFNHCGSFNKWLDKERIYDHNPDYAKGAYISANSPYRSFFKFNNEEAWPYNPSYDGWWGHDTLPKLNYEGSKKLHDYIIEIGRKWVSPPFNVDGWRLDVAADLGHSPEYNHKFWKDFRAAVKKANPDAIILAEHYDSPKAWMEGDEWDTIMNYGAFMEPITWFLTGVEKHSDEFRGDLLGNADFFKGSIRNWMSYMMYNSLYCSMNELSNHDHSRFLTRTNHRVGRINTLGPDTANENINYGIMREAVVFQMTWPGAPTIYYGDEAGVCGWTDPDSRRTYPWGRENHDLIRFHRDMIKIHNRYQALRTGSLKFLHGEHRLIAFGRFNYDEAVAVVINNDFVDKQVKLHVRELGVHNNRIMKKILTTSENGYSMESESYMVQNNVLTVTVPKGSATIFVCKL